MQKQIENLYKQALHADEEYGRVCEPYGGRWRANHCIPSVQSAYQHKVRADKLLQNALEYNEKM